MSPYWGLKTWKLETEMSKMEEYSEEIYLN